MDLPRRDGARGRVLVLITAVIALGGLIAAAGGMAADIPAGNLTTNPSFESNTTGWSGWQGTIAAVTAADAPNGAKVAQVTRSGSNSSYTIEQYYAVNSANSARGGQTYNATAWVKGTSSTAGKTVKLRLREWNGTSLAGSSEASVTLNTTGYQQVSLTYTAKTTGQAMTLDVLRENVTAAESFYVDAISLTVQPPALIAATNVITNPSFETDTAGWGTWQGTVARTTLADAPHGAAAAQVTRAGTNSAYTIERYYAVNSANSAQADRTYAVSAWVRGTSTTNNKTAKLRIREWNPNGTLAGSAEQSVTLESAKFKLAQVSYVAKTTGNALTVDIVRENVTAAESFYADAITMTVSAPLPSPNVWGNPSFETDTAAWNGYHSDLARVTQLAMPDPKDGLAAVQVTRQAGNTDYALDSWNGTFSAGNYTYTATAWVKGTPSSDGKTVSLLLREWKPAGPLVDSASADVTLDASQWKQVQLTYTAQATGDDFGLKILRDGVTAAESFYADAITVTRAAPATIPADNLIANPSFETDTSGWDSWNGNALARVTAPTVTDAPHGTSVVKVSQSASPPDPDQYNLDYWTADELLAGYVYTVSAWVRGTASTDGKTVTLRLREYGTGSEVLDSKTEPVTLEDDRFKQVQLTYEGLGGGTALGLDLLREDVTGPEAFYVDAFTMTSVAADEDEPEVDIDASPPTGDGGYDLSVTVSDPPVDAGYGSGAARLEVYLDDEFLDAVDCSSSGCTIPYSRHMSAGQTLDQHELAVVAYDRAGNSKVAYSGKPYGEGKDADFHYFGYADFFGDPDGPIGSDGPIDLDEVTEGGGNVIRFPIPWCQIAVKDPTQPGVDPQDPQDWNWTGADAFFDAVALRGDLETIPVLFDAPRYARDPGEITPEESDAEHHPELAGSCGDSRISPPADNTTANPTAINDYWGRFVSEFVARYGPGGPHDGNLAAIEAWNEPNLSVYWGGADQDDFNPDESLFAKLVNEAGAESSVPVLPGGLATAEPIYKNDKAGIARDNPDVFLGNAVDGTGTKIDPGEVAGFNFHLYANREHNTREAEKLIRQRYKSMDDVLEGRVNYADEQRWITEIGFPSGGAFNIPFLRYATEYKQYQRMDASYRFLKGQPHVRAFLAYRLRDVRITEDPDPLVVDELVEPGRFGAIHRPADDPNGPPNHKAIYCRLAERVLGEAATEDLVCEGKKAHA